MILFVWFVMLSIAFANAATVGVVNFLHTKQYKISLIIYDCFLLNWLLN